MMTQQQIDEIGKLQDSLLSVDAEKDPFLYHLPHLLKSHKLSLIPTSHAIEFTELALRHDRMPIVSDALRILNRLIDPTDGSLKTPGPDVFYENSNFFWTELGSHTSAVEVILHIFNRTIFVTSIGKK